MVKPLQNFTLSPAQLQMIKLLHTESKRGNTLLYFVCGDRVLNTLQSALEVQQKLNVLLSSPPELFASMVSCCVCCLL